MIRQSLGYRFIRAVIYRHSKLIVFRHKFPGVNLGFGCLLRFDQISNIDFGQEVEVGNHCEIVSVSDDEGYGELIVQNKVVIGSFCNIRASGASIRIGERTLIAQNVSIIGANHMKDVSRRLEWDVDQRGVVVESDTWIGVGAIILPGVRIGAGSIVAAGSVVTRSIPSCEIWGGVPAKKLSDLKTSL